MNRRVAIIIERADVALGGAERSVFELSTALSARGLEVEILAAKGQLNAKSVHIICRDTPGTRTSHSTFASALRDHFRSHRYDIVHSVLPFDFADVYQPRGGSYAESIFRNAASYSNRFITFYKRLTSFANLRRATLLRSERALCRGSDGPVVAAISQYVAEQFRQHYGLDNGRLAVIPNAVRTDKPVNRRNADSLRTQVLAQLGLKEADAPVLFLFVANNFRLKGLGALIRATARASTQRCERRICLVVAGSGGTVKYRHLASKEGIRDRIAFLGPVRHIQNLLSIVDVGVLPSYYDPSSRYILEALAAGKPVITTRFNGATDLFEDGRHGTVIDSPDCIADLAAAITHYSETENIRRSSEAIAADNLKESISVRRAAGQIEALYESIIKKRGLK